MILTTITDTNSNGSVVNVCPDSVSGQMIKDIKLLLPELDISDEMLRLKLTATKEYAYPESCVDEDVILNASYDPTGSPFKTEIGQIKFWGRTGDVLDRVNISYVDIDTKGI